MTEATKTRAGDPAKQFGVSEGDMRLVAPDGTIHEPIACGVHRSEGAFRERPKGYQSDCENCRLELESSIEGWNRSSTTEFGAGEGRREKRSGKGKAGEGTAETAAEHTFKKDEEAAKAADQVRNDDPTERKLLREHGVDPDKDTPAHSM